METLAQRDYKRFFTPQTIADFMAELLDPKKGEVILEPSAGKGALVLAVKKRNKKAIVFAIEINGSYQDDLTNAGASVVVVKDFLATPVYAKFCGCIANPPFGNGIDLHAHFIKMYELIKDNGKLICMLPEDFEVPYEHQKHEIANWATNKDGTVTPIKIISLTKKPTPPLAI